MSAATISARLRSTPGWLVLALAVAAALLVALLVVPDGPRLLQEAFNEESAGQPAEVASIADKVDQLAAPLLWVSIGFAPLVAGVGGVMIATGNPGGVKFLWAAAAGPFVILLTRGLAA